MLRLNNLLRKVLARLMINSAAAARSEKEPVGIMGRNYSPSGAIANATIPSRQAEFASDDGGGDAWRPGRLAEPRRIGNTNRNTELQGRHRH